MSTTYDEGLNVQLNFLRQQLSGAGGDVLQLPVFNSRPRTRTFQSSTNSFIFPIELSARIRTLAHKTECSPAELMLAGFKALLFRYSRQSPIVICIPAGNGNIDGSGPPVQFFKNWMVLRAHVSPDMNFEQLARHVNEQLSTAHAHHELLCEKLVEEFELVHDLNLDALSGVAFDFHDKEHRTDSQLVSGTASGPASANGNGGSESSVDASRNGENDPAQGKQTFKFNLRLSMTEDAQQYGGTVEYSPDLFEQSDVLRLIGHFQTLIEAMLDDPQHSIGELHFMTAAERRQTLIEWNKTRGEYAAGQCVQELFEAQALRTPDAPAISFASQQLTYQQLNEHANRLAHRLRSLGVGPEQVVGICLEGSLELPIAVMGVLKAGAAYLPLDPAYPQSRLSFMLSDADVKLLLTQRHLTEKFANLTGVNVIALDALPEFTAGQPTHNPPLCTLPRNACYLIYTSGSTGRPKGIVVEHRSLVNLVQALKVVCGVGPGDRVLQFASFSFDQSVRELFEPLTSGAELCLERREQLMPGKPLLDVLRTRKITAVTLAPSVLAHLPEAALPELTKLSAGGEALPGSVVDRWAAGRSFFNAYGPSEITFASSLPSCFAGAGKPTIGKPLRNVRYYVVDERLQPCALGMAGELLVGGVGLARGYVGRPDLTAERFIPDPFGGGSGERLYRTGDLVRWLPNGEVDYLGRIDQQVKLHGLRIELGEIEAVLMEHEAVAAATVNLYAEAPGREQLVAYVVASGAELPVEQVKKFLASRVPDYMVPPVFISVEKIPLTPAGKVDRSALPLPDSVRQRKTYVPPSTQSEQKMVEIWKRVLEVDEVSADDNFFELGGSSLRGTMLIALIEDEFNVKATFAKVFEHPTLRELSELIDGGTGQITSSHGKGVVSLRKAETQARHLFFVHDSSGGVDALLPLGHRLSPDWNVWGIQAGQLEPEVIPDVTIKQLAADYIEEIRSIQPDGPWFVGGWSFGGVVAYEVARQLEAEGGRVGLLMLIDSESPNSRRWEQVLTDFVDSLRARFKPAAAAVASVEDKSKACQMLLARIARYQNAGERIRACTPDSISQAIAGWDNLDEEHLFAALSRVMSYVGALSVYEPSGRVSVDVEDFRASVTAEHVNSDDWGAFVSGRVRCHRLDGDHRSILNPPVVDVLATAMSEILQERLDPS